MMILCKWLSCSIWPIDGTPTGATNRGQSRPRCNGTEEVRHITKNSRIGATQMPLSAKPRRLIRQDLQTLRVKRHQICYVEDTDYSQKLSSEHLFRVTQINNWLIVWWKRQSITINISLWRNLSINIRNVSFWRYLKGGIRATWDEDIKRIQLLS